jgi:hypothetical protein
MTKTPAAARPRDHLLVFDDYLSGTTPVHSRPEFNEALARPDQLEVVMLVSESTGTAMILNCETSPDEMNWFSVDSLWVTAHGMKLSVRPAAPSAVTMGECLQRTYCRNIRWPVRVPDRSFGKTNGAGQL